MIAQILLTETQNHLASIINQLEPETYSEGLFGHELLNFNYFHIGLKGISVDDYWDDDNPVSWGFASLMDSGERERTLLLIECYRRVRDSILNEAEKSLLTAIDGIGIGSKSTRLHRINKLHRQVVLGSSCETIAFITEQFHQTLAQSLWLRFIYFSRCMFQIIALLCLETTMINFIVTCFQLTLGEEADFQRLLEQENYQEVREMRQTYFDKLEHQGSVKGMQNILSQLLQTKFGALPESVADRIRKIKSENELTELAIKVVTATSLAELGLDNA